MSKKSHLFFPFKVLKLIITLNKSTENVNIASMIIIIFLPRIVSKLDHRLNKTTVYFIQYCKYFLSIYVNSISSIQSINRDQDFNISDVFFQFFSFQSSKTSQNIEQVNSKEIFIEHMSLNIDVGNLSSQKCTDILPFYEKNVNIKLSTIFTVNWQVLKLNISICGTI